MGNEISMFIYCYFTESVLSHWKALRRNDVFVLFSLPLVSTVLCSYTLCHTKKARLDYLITLHPIDLYPTPFDGDGFVYSMWWYRSPPTEVTVGMVLYSTVCATYMITVILYLCFFLQSSLSTGPILTKLGNDANTSRHCVPDFTKLDPIQWIDPRGRALHCLFVCLSVCHMQYLRHHCPIFTKLGGKTLPWLARVRWWLLWKGSSNFTLPTRYALPYTLRGAQSWDRNS